MILNHTEGLIIVPLHGAWLGMFGYMWKEWRHNTSDFIIQDGILIDLPKVCQNVKNERIRKGLTQNDFGTYDPRTIRKIENAEVKTINPILDFCRTNNIDIDSIMSGATYRIRKTGDIPILIPIR